MYIEDIPIKEEEAKSPIESLQNRQFLILCYSLRS